MRQWFLLSIMIILFCKLFQLRIFSFNIENVICKRHLMGFNKLGCLVQQTIYLHLQDSTTTKPVLGIAEHTRLGSHQALYFCS
jgi:hypothetical protein